MGIDLIFQFISSVVGSVTSGELAKKAYQRYNQILNEVGKAESYNQNELAKEVAAAVEEQAVLEIEGKAKQKVMQGNLITIIVILILIMLFLPIIYLTKK